VGIGAVVSVGAVSLLAPVSAASSTTVLLEIAARAVAVRLPVAVGGACWPNQAAASSPPPSLLGEIAGVTRFATDAKLARTAGSAPIPAFSGRTQRHRLDRGGNRQLNCALHRLAITKRRLDPETPPTSEGKTRRDAVRCLKRHRARRIWHLLQPDAAITIPTSTPARPSRVITIHCDRPRGTVQLT
jgi:hypothetical protein